MAKKKAAMANGKQPAAKKTTSKNSVAKSALAERTVSNDDIGDIAGEVWQLLHDQGEQTPAAIKKGIKAPGDLVMTAVGWLAREGKLEFQTAGRSVKVSLK
ncbi:MAG: winged helix-turn-helix domain-containing protein [Aeoliella sp.]